jgi:stress response protein YsnF
MLTEREVSASIGGTAYSSSGDKIGTVEHYFVDDRTGAPSWVAVTTGLFGTRHSIVPATEATFADGGLHLPVTVDAVKSAPHLEGDHLGPDEEAHLRRHYGQEGLPAGAPTWQPTGEGLRPPGADDDLATATPTATTEAPLPPPPASYGTTEPSDGGMVRSEERLQVGTERVAATRVRLVKYVVTEEVQITVPIRREEIRIEEVPIDAADDGSAGESLVPGDEYGAHSARPAGTAGGPTAGLPDEVILHTERPVVTVEVVPRERVRLRTELVQGQETVTGQVQREEIVVDETPSAGFSPR